MGKIIAVGGGVFWKSKDAEPETTLIDKEIVFQTWKKNPKFLFIPTANYDSVEYYDVIKKHFTGLWCSCDVLYLTRDKLTKKQIEDKIFSSDIVYVGGGNTLRMMNIWKKLGVDDILKKAYKTYWKKWKYYKEEIEIKDEFNSLDLLLKK